MDKWLALLGRYYRDIAAVLFFLLIYPILLHPRFYQGGHKTLASLYFLLSLLGFLGNGLVLWQADVRMQKPLKPSLRPFRFLGGFIALPVFSLFGLMMLWEPPVSDAKFIGSYILFCCLSGWIVWSFGFGTPKKGQPKAHPQLHMVGTIALLLYELTLYTLFLETMPRNEAHLYITLRTLLILIIPMTLLYLLLFLPATLGFLVEDCMRYGDWRKALARGYLRFIFYRYLPAYLALYATMPARD